MPMRSMTRVALLAEGVDRNLRYARGEVLDAIVALLAEGVDRNLSPASGSIMSSSWSPSSRRAWIEISAG